MRITSELLCAHGACSNQVDQFVATFPDGADVTLENLQIARAAGLEIYWLNRLLSAPAWQAYDAACESAWQIYAAASAPAWQAYAAACESAWHEYDAAYESAWQAYDAACESARQAYAAACESALVAAFDSMDREHAS